MYKTLMISILQIYTLSTIVYGDCALCEEIKEKNRNLPPLKHIYYEDYLEELRAEGSSTVGQIEFEENIGEKNKEKVRDQEVRDARLF